MNDYKEIFNVINDYYDESYYYVLYKEYNDEIQDPEIDINIKGLDKIADEFIDELDAELNAIEYIEYVLIYDNEIEIKLKSD